MMQPDDPPFLTVGTEVSAKYKGAFCEAKVNKVVKAVKVKVTFKYGQGFAVVHDDCIKGPLKVGAQVKAVHPDKNQYLDGIINKIQDCSQYTVVFDDGDITTLRRSSLCLKSGRHFAESETLDQLPLTHPEHFGTPVVGGRRGRRSRHHHDSDDASSEDEDNVHKRHRSGREEWESDIGKVVCVEIGDKKKQKDNWFPGLVVAPTAQDSVKIETKKDYLVRSFQDGRYYTVPKKEATAFSREIGSKVTQSSLRTAVEKAFLYIDRDELPPHWDRDLLFGVDMSDLDLDKDSDSDTSDDEPREEKDHFVAQLYKFMEECGTPINKGPTIGTKDLDLYKLFKIVQKLGGFNRVMNQNQWKVVSVKMCLHTLNQSASLVKAAYRKYLQSFEDFYRKLGCTMVSSPRGSRTRHRSGRSLIRDCDKRPTKKKGRGGETDSAGDDTDRKDEESEEEDSKKEERVKEEVEEKKIDKKVKEEVEEKKIDKKVKEEVEEKKIEKKEKEEIPQRTSTPPVTPARTMSPTTRERTKEVKGLRPDKLKPKVLVKEQRSDDVKKKDIKEEPPVPPVGRKSRMDEGKRREVREVKEEIKKEESDSEEEVEEKTQTRSLRNREDKEKDPSETKKMTDKKVRHDHQRSASCNSTSSGTSSTSTSTSSSFTGDAKAGLKNKAKLPQTPSSCEDIKKRGRKKRTESSENEAGFGKSLLPLHVPISIGDKLLVLYGPTNKEAKVTYEAKVLEVEENTANKMYYVHYLGWNTRYDEWVERPRVAQNLTWSQTRAKKGRAASKEAEKKEEEKKKEMPVASTSRPVQTVPPKRGRPFLSARRESDRSDSASSTRASTRSERGNQPHSHSASPSSDRLPSERRRSRRNVLSTTIRDTEESESDDTEPETDELEQDQKSEPEMKIQAEMTNSPPISNNEIHPPAITPPLTEVKTTESHVEPEIKHEPPPQVPVSSSQNSCGKDIDLKAIESEMKGLDKPIKKEEILSIKEVVTGRILTTVIPGSLTITEKKKHNPNKPFDSPVKRMEIPVRLVPAQEIMGQIKPLPISGMKKEPLLEDDIYEFKEPEPFEFSDIRSRKDCTKNRTQGSCMQEENESEAKVKKKGRPKKEGEDKSESESEVGSLTPQKRILTPSKEIKESPVKRIEVNKETPVKKEFKDYSRRPETFKAPEEKVVKDIVKEPLRIASPPCLQIKETGSPECIEKPFFIDFFNNGKEKQMQRMPLDIKDLKLDLSDSKESHFFGSSVVITPKKLPVKKDVISSVDPSTPVKSDSVDIIVPKPLKIDFRDDTLYRQEPPKIGVIPTSGNSSHIAVVIDRPASAPVLSRVPGGTPSHIMAPVVMPPVESRVLAKPVGIKPPIIDSGTEKTLIITPTTSVPTINSAKQEERNEGKLMPFSQRQQHIFPHLLNRSDPTEEKTHSITIPRTCPIITPVVVLPVNTQPTHLQTIPEPQITALIVSSSSKVDAVDTKPIISKVEKPQPLERPKCESTVEESIEAVVLRARQDQSAVEEEKKESKIVEKRRRAPGRSKKLVSREFLPDTSEESDNDSKYDKAEHRQKRLKISDRAKHSPAKKAMRLSGEGEKTMKRCDEEERANDADEEDNECNFIPQKSTVKEAFKQRRKDSECEVEKEQQGDRDMSRFPKKKRTSTFRRPEDAEEAALGDLLCEETIPPGSPMPHDNLSADSESPAQMPAIKHEMPFASVPTGSSFSKRGPTLPPALQANFQKLQQLHPSVCIQSVSKPPTISSQSFCPTPQPTIQPNVTITSVGPIPQLHSLPAAKVSSVSSLSSFRGPSVSSPISAFSTPARTLPTRTTVEVLPKNVVVSSTNIYNPESNNTKLSGPASQAQSSSPVVMPPSVDPIIQKEEEQKAITIRPNPLPTLDNTPPTTPESIVSNLSDSPQRENDSSKNDENSKSGGQYSSEMETDNKLDNYSEDSNTMDSNVSVSKCHSSSKRPSSVILSRGPCQQSHSEGWDTEDGSAAGLLPPKRRKKGSRKSHQVIDDDSKGSAVAAGVGSSGNGKRRRRHSSSRGSSRCDDENDPAHGLNTLSLAACNTSRGKSRYNFCQELDPDLDATKRIAVLQNRIQELKRTYRHVKAELASIERRRKKLRKKEKEKEAQQEGS